MVVQAEEGRLIAAAAVGLRVLVATAVPAERDAVARAFAGSFRELRLPGAVLHRLSPAAGEPTPGRSAADPTAASQSAADVTAAGEAPAGPAAVDLTAVGVGPALAGARTAAALTAAALDGAPYTLVVSAGIAGGFQPAAPVGSLVVADRITAADLGAETAQGFVPVTELGFGTVTHSPPDSLVRDLARVTGARTGEVLTVSTVTGTAERAERLRARHPRALAEAMEGFGVAEAAAAHGVPVVEIRAVSNPVGPRDRAAWRIADALAALTDGFGKLLPVLESWNKHDQ
ncbi:futalosine hydrolase [Streptomyces sp. NPDC020996]|uniref:futalosine hydrolase n=1 Tax=Streptomyces sp. NPDC020996 TaxID=3154791 RepID=UPI003405F4A3